MVSHYGFDLHSLMTNDIELFVCLLAICTSVLEKHCSDLLPIFRLGYLPFYYWVTKSSLHILDTIFHPFYVLQIFSPIIWVMFSLS